jgi:hypothetical protein
MSGAIGIEELGRITHNFTRSKNLVKKLLEITESPLFAHHYRINSGSCGFQNQSLHIILHKMLWPVITYLNSIKFLNNQEL